MRSPSVAVLVLLACSLPATACCVCSPSKAAGQTAPCPLSAPPPLPAQAADAGSLLCPTGAGPEQASLLAAAAGARQPLLPLSLNLGIPQYHGAATAAPSCFGL